MAQPSISSYYRSTRKRAGEDEAFLAKRRKTASQELQSSVCSFIQPESGAETRTRRATRSGGAKAKPQATAASRRPRRKAKQTPGPSLDSLLAGMRQDTRASAAEKISPPIAVQAPSPPKAVPAPTPSKAVPAPTPSKAVPAPTLSKTVPPPTLSKAVPPPTPSKAVPASTPSRGRQESRARQTAVKMSVCRKLLADPGQDEERPRMVPVAELRALKSMSVRELAQPSAVEKAHLKVEEEGSETPQMSSFSAFHVTSPIKPSSPRQPAYQRHQSLITGDVPELPLPQKYLLLAEKFRCVDMVANMLQKRGETCTLRKLKEAVEEMLKRAFAEQNLGQMKHVYPGAFVFRQERHIPGNYDRQVFEEYQLTVECNVEETGQESVKPCVSSSDGHCFLSAQALLQRRRTFRCGLEHITRQHHKEYLTQMGIYVADSELKRWHPDFPLHEVADVPVSPLPAPPKCEEIVSAQEVLARFQQRIEAESEDTMAPVAMPTPEVAALKGVPVHLIEKVRQREAEQMRRHLVRNSETQKKLDILSRLGSLCRILNSHFVTSKKVALPLDEVLQKLSESHSSELSKDLLEAHLEVMVEVLGQWVRKVEIRSKVYIKRVDKMMDMKTLAHIIRRKQTELERL